MRTTVTLDDELFRQARELLGVTERRRVLDEALRALIERESSRRLARLNGAVPAMEEIRRRRSRSA